MEREMNTLVTRKRFKRVTTTSFSCAICGYDEVKVVATDRTTGPARILSVSTTPHSLLCGVCEADEDLRSRGYVPETVDSPVYVLLAMRHGAWTVVDRVHMHLGAHR